MRLPGCVCADCAERDLYLCIRVLLPGRQHCDTRSTPRSHLTPKSRDVFLHPGCSESNAAVRTKPLIRGRVTSRDPAFTLPEGGKKKVMFFAVRSGSFFFPFFPPVLHSSEITVRHRADRGNRAVMQCAGQQCSGGARDRGKEHNKRARARTQ